MEMEKIENVLLSRRIRENSVIRNVAIVGGTHGNELHGVQKLQRGWVPLDADGGLFYGLNSIDLPVEPDD